MGHPRMRGAPASADDPNEMSLYPVDNAPPPAAAPVVDEQGLLDAQARLSLAVAGLDGGFEALF
jgi:hypothetical protein